MTNTTRMMDHFSLAHFERALEGFRPPDEAFDPHGSWENAYSIFECSQGMRAVGALRIARERGRDGATLRIHHTKQAVGGSVRCVIEMVCASDALATPRRWTADTVVLDTEGAPIEETRLVETGDVRRGALRVKAGDRARKIEVGEPFAFHWALFDAIQRMRPAAETIHRFTLVDRLSYQVKPNHTLTYRTSAQVEVGGRKTWREEKQELDVGTVYRPVPAREGAVPTMLHAFDQTGEGILPIVYWVTDQGRLLFALSGLIGHIYNPGAGA